MKIADIHSAKRHKFRLTFVGTQKGNYAEDKLIDIRRTAKKTEFFVETFGGVKDICSCDRISASLIDDFLEHEELGNCRCVFVIEGLIDASLVIQLYTFSELKDYKTAITIKVPNDILEKNKSENKSAQEKLGEEFIWDGLGLPAIFSLSYKEASQRKDIRLLSNKRMMQIDNTARGFIVKKTEYRRDRTDLPISVFIAPKIQFVTEHDTGINNEELSIDLKNISNAETYFARWEAYNKLAENQIRSRAEEFGEIKYNDVVKTPTEKGMRFEFTINDEVPMDFLGSCVEVFISPMEGEKKPNNIRVGDIVWADGNILTTFLNDSELIVNLPKQGTIVLSTFGDEVIIKRRVKAKARMLAGQSPIKSIVKLIEEGVSELNRNWGDAKAVTQNLERNYLKAKNLNERQRKALDTAINSPDIAIIQGPPGTGKTTVIKAICERYREVFEAQQRRENDDEILSERLKILISSFQNEAVDNAISNQSLGDMPAYRLGKKNKEQYQKSIEEWYNGICGILQESAKCPDAIKFIEQKRKFADAFFSYKNSGETIVSAISLIREYLAVSEIEYPEELKRTANAIIIEYQKKGKVAQEVDDPIIAKLNSQRLTKTAFLDDGRDNARRLYAHLTNRDDLNILDGDKKAIANVFADDEFIDIVFNQYVEVVKRLQAKFCHEQLQVDISNKVKIEKVLLELANAFSNGYLSLSDDLETKKSLIIGEFLGKLENEYEDLVGKYSLTTAATCQTSLQISKGVDETYGLVIIDEAARATPLDLFIPMSMGKKIVLVGDHKQLPHMLEPEVLKVIVDDPLYKDLKDIEKSLFERLFEMFKGGPRPKAIKLNTQYRMSPDICKFVSDEFYEGDLLSDDEYEAKIAKDRIVPSSIFGGKALGFVDIGLTHGQETKGISKSREVEVTAITNDVKNIFKFEPKASIGVITFYIAQEKLLRIRLDSILNDEQKDFVSIGTVDSFQGKEFDYVLLSGVRANSIKDSEQKSVGFLVKPNRTCVAFSRAKKQLTVYGDGETLSQVSCFKNLLDKCKNKKEGYYREY